MKKKILFFGLGSIGARHAKLLLEHFDADLYAYRTGKPSNTFGVKEFHSLEEAFENRPDAAFITNPTNLHIGTAIECAKRSIDLFIEKPLSNRIEGVDTLIGLISQNRLVNHVAFCLRYHPVIKYLKEILKREEVFYTRTINSSYLPSWRPGQDYRESYSADRTRGGGVMNELIHELDYNEYLFGRTEQLNGSTGRASSLDISADDYSEFQLDHSTGIKSHVSLDFFSHYRERTIKIYCPEKVIVADIINQTVKTYKEHGLINEKKLGEENMYLNQLNCFFNALEKRSDDNLCTVAESRNLVEKLSQFN
jgi:predicted dehydrogenase